MNFVHYIKENGHDAEQKKGITANQNWVIVHYKRSTYYVGNLKYEYGTTYNWFIDSRQQSFLFLLTYTL